jgi:hypothetical protein
MFRLTDKDPEEVLDYTVDFADWLGNAATLVNSPPVSVALEGTSTPGSLSDLVIEGVTQSTTEVRFFLTSGTDGETYYLKVEAADNSSPQRVIVRRAVVKVVGK